MRQTPRAVLFLPCGHPSAKERLMKFAIATPKPRNPFATAARLRHGGSHRPSTGALRQRSRQHLRQTLAQLDPRKDSP
jgi:hypothetical protein